MVLPSYAPRETPDRSGNIRMPSALTMDASLNKNFKVTERLQFRAEAFNLLNHFVTPRALQHGPQQFQLWRDRPGRFVDGGYGFSASGSTGLQGVLVRSRRPRMGRVRPRSVHVRGGLRGRSPLPGW